MSDAVDTPTDEAAAAAQQKRFELYAAVLLGIAALATAWSAYQAAFLGGEELEAFTESNQALADANFFYGQGQAQLNADHQLFVEYAVAATSGNVELADYLRTTLMDPNLQAAVGWWEATEEAVTPFDEAEDNPYTVESYTEADELQQSAEEKLAEAQRVGNRGDQFDLAAVLLAATLFFGGISIIFDRPGVVRVLLGVSALGLVSGLVVMFTA